MVLFIKFKINMREIQREIVSGLIFAKDGKLFQGQKDPQKGGVYCDCWHLPGGGAEPGEDKKTALAREIKEETGIDIAGYGVELADDSGRGESKKVLGTGEEVLCQMKFFVYRIDVDKNSTDIEINLNDDLVKFRWTDPKELPGLKLTPPSVELFQKLGYL